MSSVDQTGSSHIPRGSHFSRRSLRAYISDAVRFQHRPGSHFLCLHNVPAITFGSIFVPTTNLAAPRSTVWCVCESSRLRSIPLDVPAPDLSILLSPAVSCLVACFKTRGRQGLIVRCHVSVSTVVRGVCCGSSCPSRNICRTNIRGTSVEMENAVFPSRRTGGLDSRSS